MEQESKTVTIADVADALGVSKTTVSRAISGKGRLSEETRRRVMDYIAQCDYRPSVIARSLAQSKTFNVCVVMPEDYNRSDLPFFHQAVIGIQEIAGARDYDVLLCSGREEDCSALARILENRKVDGVILLRTYTHDCQIGLLQKQSLPFVAVGSTDSADVYQVDHDQTKACRELTARILDGMTPESDGQPGSPDCGFAGETTADRGTSVALLGGRDSLVITKNRMAGFRQAFEARGLKPQEELIYRNLETREAVSRAAEDALSKGAGWLICMDDVICSQALTALHFNQVRIPEDVRVASFYNSWVLENHVPAIPAISFDAKELGREACRMLFSLLDGEKTEQKKILPYRILFSEN